MRAIARFGLIFVLLVAVRGRALGAQDLDPALDFERAGLWRTEAALTKHFDESLLRCRTDGVPFARLVEGIEIVSEPRRNGRAAGRWSSTTTYPSMVCDQVPPDWSGAKGFSFWAHSAQATGQVICLAVRADSAATPYRDFRYTFFRVDWTGWKQLRFALGDFVPYGEPAGWDHVEGVGFHAKAFSLRPHPATVLVLDAMRLDAAAPGPGESAAVAYPYPERPQEMPPFPWDVLNHGDQETRGGKPVLAPIKHEPYGKTSRALSDYYPRFAPGPVSFDLKGRACLRYGNIIEVEDAKGKWRAIDLLPEIRKHALEKLGYVRLRERDSLGQGDPTVRFDKDGDAYVVAWVHVWEKGGRARYIGMLLHSRDGMQTWTVYDLPFAFAYFEKLDGHNTDCMKRPPVILLSESWSPTDNYLLIPEKQKDGTLRIPKPVLFAENAAGVGGHSGDGNMALTVGDKVFVTFAAMRPLDASPDEFVQKSRWEVRRKDGTQVPTPLYIRAYDIKTGALSKPVYMGPGGHTIDPHNSPAITIDSKGTIHAILNGHHDPFVYVHSKEPRSIEAWSDPEPVEKMTSYASLNCDANDTLYTVTRYSQRQYTSELGFHRKKAGQPWEAARVLVSPYRNYYYVWRHRVTLDTRTGRLFLFYFARSPHICLFLDEYMAMLHERPDYEKTFYDRKKKVKLPRGTARSAKGERKYAFFDVPPSEPTVLVSEDGGDNWRLATSPDFLP